MPTVDQTESLNCTFYGPLEPRSVVQQTSTPPNPYVGMIYTANINALDESEGRHLKLMMITTATGHTNLQGNTDTGTSKIELMKWEGGYPSATFNTVSCENQLFTASNGADGHRFGVDAAGKICAHHDGVDFGQLGSMNIFLDSASGDGHFKRTGYFGGNLLCAGTLTSLGAGHRFGVDSYGNIYANYNGVNFSDYTSMKIFLDSVYGHAYFKGNVTYKGQLIGPEYGTTGKYVFIQLSGGSLAMDYLGVNPSIPSQARIYLDSLYGHGNFAGTVYSGGVALTSDDRYKINERPITDAMQTLANLQFYEYDKVRDPTDTEGYKVERGVIAQQLESGPLSFAVDHSRPEKLAVNYQDINITTAQALKDLMAEVQTLRDRVAALEANFPTV